MQQKISANTFDRYYNTSSIQLPNFHSQLLSDYGPDSPDSVEYDLTGPVELTVALLVS